MDLTTIAVAWTSLMLTLFVAIDIWRWWKDKRMKKEGTLSLYCPRCSQRVATTKLRHVTGTILGEKVVGVTIEHACVRCGITLMTERVTNANP